VQPDVTYLRYFLNYALYFRSNHLSLKYQKFIPPGCEDMEIKRYEFVAKIQFLKAILLVQLRNLLAPLV